jgi:hypothetical protein
MTGRSLLPGCFLDLTASIKDGGGGVVADSSVDESDVLRSDSLEDE